MHVCGTSESQCCETNVIFTLSYMKQLIRRKHLYSCKMTAIFFCNFLFTLNIRMVLDTNVDKFQLFRPLNIYEINMETNLFKVLAASHDEKHACKLFFISI